MNNVDWRPDPDNLLEDIQKIQNTKNTKVGNLKIFFGYAAGVGKTYAMLDDAQEILRSGKNVLVGYIEPHTRPDTLHLLQGIPYLLPKIIKYRNLELKEFDLDEALKLKPDLIIVDELAHTNAEGVRNRKRYQDVEELLNAGIDVFTTVNVQHIESLNDVIEKITGIKVKETVPDFVFDRASKINLIDIEPDELLRRIEEGKIYKKDRASTAVNNFFTQENLKLLREIAMRKAADRISNENQRVRHSTEKMISTKMLVCISPSPNSAKCIRWTARAAEAFHAQWVALYVESIESNQLNLEQQKNLRENMDLAEKLGAEVVVLTGHDISMSISEYAKTYGITNIVVGKSQNRKNFRSLFDVAFEDKLISQVSNIEVHIIPGAISNRKIKRSFFFVNKMKIDFSWSDFVKMITLLIGATLISLVLQKVGIGDQNIIMTYILSVLVISRITKGFIFGIISSVTSVLAFNFFFTVPYYTFNAIQPGYPVTFLIMLVVALITSALTIRIKNHAKLAVQREHRTEVLYEINKKLLITRGLENIVSLTNEYISNLFGRSVVFYPIDPENGDRGILRKDLNYTEDKDFESDDERAVAHWVFVNKKIAGAGTDTLMGSVGFYMPVISQTKVLAVIGLLCDKSILDHNERQFLRMIVSQIAMALERQRLSDEQRTILVNSEKEKMRSNLLRAIAHDLRTPLAGILGASSVIRENKDTLDDSIKDKLNLDIQEEAQWLIRMVENLLSVTRINDGESKVTKTPEAAEEVVAVAVSRIRKRFPNHKVDVTVPNQLLEVPMDGTLIAQVLINLIENAIKHSPMNDPVEVILSNTNTYARFEVKDHGTGIIEEDLPNLFTSYIPKNNRSSDSSRGMGIGLSICMTIIKAHNGTMEAYNQNKGGAVFMFTLPLEKGIEYVKTNDSSN